MARAISLLALVASLGCGSDTDRSRTDAGPAPGRQGPAAPSLGDGFGAAVIASEAELVVGIPGDDTGGDGAGSVVVLHPSTFEVIQELGAEEPRLGAGFGAALAGGDQILAVGAPGDRLGGGDATGAVHIFERGAGQWQPAAVIGPEALAPGDRFGAAVSVSGDRLVVGAPGDDRDGDGAGAVYFFERSGADWVPADP